MDKGNDIKRDYENHPINLEKKREKRLRVYKRVDSVLQWLFIFAGINVGVIGLM